MRDFQRLPWKLLQQPRTSHSSWAVLYQIFRHAHLSGDGLELLRRRVVFLTALAWLPLLVLASRQGHTWGGGVRVPFLRDFDVHVRLLVALPLLVLAEFVVNQRMKPVLAQENRISHHRSETIDI